MIREFGYNWAPVVRALVGMIVAGGLLTWYAGGVDRPFLIIVGILGVFYVGREALPLSKIILTESELLVFYLIPIQRGGRFRHEDIEIYAEITLPYVKKKFPIGGYVKPKNQEKGMTILSGGVKNFDELHAALLELYPRVETVGAKARKFRV